MPKPCVLKENSQFNIPQNTISTTANSQNRSSSIKLDKDKIVPKESIQDRDLPSYDNFMDKNEKKIKNILKWIRWTVI